MKGELREEVNGKREEDRCRLPRGRYKREERRGRFAGGRGKREKGREKSHVGVLNFRIIVISIRLMLSIADVGISDGLM